MTPPRWTQNSPMQKALTDLFTTHTIDRDSRATQVFSRYADCWPGVNKNTFTKHFLTTRKRLLNIPTPGMQPPNQAPTEPTNEPPLQCPLLT